MLSRYGTKSSMAVFEHSSLRMYFYNVHVPRRRLGNTNAVPLDQIVLRASIFPNNPNSISVPDLKSVLHDHTQQFSDLSIESLTDSIKEIFFYATEFANANTKASHAATEIIYTLPLQYEIS